MSRGSAEPRMLSVQEGMSYDSSSNATYLSAEVALLLAPTQSVAITVGPTLDDGLSASGDQTQDGVTTKDDDEPSKEFGAQAGLSVFF